MSSLQFQHWVEFAFFLYTWAVKEYAYLYIYRIHQEQIHKLYLEISIT